MCLFDFNYFFHYGGLKKYLYEVCISLYMYVLFLDMHIKVRLKITDFFASFRPI